MNTAPAPATTATSTGEVAHLAVFSPGEWLAQLVNGRPVRAYCGALRTPRPDADRLPVCPACLQVKVGL